MKIKFRIIYKFYFICEILEYLCTIVKTMLNITPMEKQFVAGNAYTKEEIESKGFTKTKQTSILVFYRNGDDLLSFDVPKPKTPDAYKLISISKD